MFNSDNRFWLVVEIESWALMLCHDLKLFNFCLIMYTGKPRIIFDELWNSPYLQSHQQDQHRSNRISIDHDYASPNDDVGNNFYAQTYNSKVRNVKVRTKIFLLYNHSLFCHWIISGCYESLSVCIWRDWSLENMARWSHSLLTTFIIFFQ